MIYSLVEAQVREAVSKDENINADGSINWNYVDSDCYMSGVNKYFKDDTAYYETWNDIADIVEKEQPVDTSVQLSLFEKYPNAEEQLEVLKTDYLGQ
jgi:hypothetical protein